MDSYCIISSFRSKLAIVAFLVKFLVNNISQQGYFKTLVVITILATKGGNAVSYGYKVLSNDLM